MTTVELSDEQVEKAIATRRRHSSEYGGKKAILKDNLQALIRLRQAGLSFRDISKVFKEETGVYISRSTIRSFLSKHFETTGMPEAKAPPKLSETSAASKPAPDDEDETGDSYRNQIAALKEKVIRRQAGERPNTAELRRHLDI